MLFGGDRHREIFQGQLSDVSLGICGSRGRHRGAGVWWQQAVQAGSGAPIFSRGVAKHNFGWTGLNRWGAPGCRYHRSGTGWRSGLLPGKSSGRTCLMYQAWPKSTMPKTSNSRTGKMMANSTATAPCSARRPRFASDPNLHRIVFLAKPTNCALSIRVPGSRQGDCRAVE